MKRFFTLIILFVAFSSIGTLSYAAVEIPGSGNDEPECTVTTYCFSGLLKVGEISCTGKQCARGFSFVECEGNRTDC